MEEILGETIDQPQGKRDYEAKRKIDPIVSF
jgi:hypothetical protein